MSGDYNYLGLITSSTGQLEIPIKDEARKTYYAIRKSLYKFNPPVRLWLKTFSSVLKPILLYRGKFGAPSTKLIIKYGTKVQLRHSISSSIRAF